MRKSGMSKMNLFFLECMVSIVMFTGVSLVILQAFMKVEEMRMGSQEEMQALVIMCTIAERIQAEKLEVPEESSWYYNTKGEVLQEGGMPHFQVELTKQETIYEGGGLQNYGLKAYSLLQSHKQLVGEMSFATYTPQVVPLEAGGEGREN